MRTALDTEHVWFGWTTCSPGTCFWTYLRPRWVWFVLLHDLFQLLGDMLGWWAHTLVHQLLSTVPQNLQVLLVWMAKSGWFDSGPMQTIPDPVTLTRSNPDSYPSDPRFFQICLHHSVAISGSAFRVQFIWSQSHILLQIPMYWHMYVPVFFWLIGCISGQNEERHVPYHIRQSSVNPTSTIVGCESWVVLAKGPGNPPVVCVWTSNRGSFDSQPGQRPDLLTIGGRNPDPYPSSRDLFQVWLDLWRPISGPALPISHLLLHSDMLLVIVTY